MIKVIIDSIRVSMLKAQNQETYRIIILLDQSTNRHLPIWVGPCEGDALVVKLQEKEKPPMRPMTYDVFTAMLQKTNLEIAKVCIRSVIDKIYYADIIAKQRRWFFWKREFTFDCRPADAILLALHLNCPIYVADHVMAQYSIKPGQSDVTDNPDPSGNSPSEAPHNPSSTAPDTPPNPSA